MKKEVKRGYNINYLYKSNDEGKDFDKLLEALFKKYLINYEK